MPLLLSLILVGPAHGATITQELPPDDLLIPTTSSSTRVVLSWTVDRHGCQGESLTARPVIVGPIPVPGQAITGEMPSGANVLTFLNSRPMRRYQWYVTMNCPGVGEVRSATRSFVIQGANPQPRLIGGHRVRWSGSIQTWRFQPTCASGACATRVRIPGIPAFLLRYNAAKGVYTARITGRKASRAAVCTNRTTGKRYLDSYRGWFNLTIRPSATAVSGVHTLATKTVGRLTSRYVPNARGTALGCAPFRSNDSVRTLAP